MAFNSNLLLYLNSFNCATPDLKFVFHSVKWKFGRELYAESEEVLIDLNIYSISGIFEDTGHKY
jgi:hypothetical protein